MGKRVEGTTARTVDLNWPKVYSIPDNFMLSNKTVEGLFLR